MVLVIYKIQVRGDTVDSAVKRNRYEIDMCNGTVLDKLISFSIPLMLSGILQLLFNAVDIIVVGRFTGSQALAAVGSTTALINVFTNLFIGVSLGANVLAARFYASAAADVPATGERITEDEDVAAAAGEGFVGEAVAGVDGCLAGGVHPAGCLGEVEFAERAIGIVSAAAERDAVFVEAAPEAGEICARAEVAVDVVEGGLIVAEGGPAVRELINAEGFCAGGKLAVVERGEIKTAVE